jgi:hypothetical protein
MLAFMMRREVLAWKKLPSIAGGATNRTRGSLSAFFHWGDRARQAGKQLDYILVFPSDTCIRRRLPPRTCSVLITMLYCVF